jgi:hypothetical protein
MQKSQRVVSKALLACIAALGTAAQAAKPAPTPRPLTVPQCQQTYRNALVRLVAIGFEIHEVTPTNTVILTPKGRCSPPVEPTVIRQAAFKAIHDGCAKVPPPKEPPIVISPNGHC